MGQLLSHIPAQRPMAGAQQFTDWSCSRANLTSLATVLSEYACCGGNFRRIDGDGRQYGGTSRPPVETVRSAAGTVCAASIDDELGCPSREQVREGGVGSFDFSPVLARSCWPRRKMISHVALGQPGGRLERQAGERDFLHFFSSDARRLQPGRSS